MTDILQHNLTLARGKSGNPELEEEWLQLACEIFSLFCTKQNDYGSQNIAQTGFKGIVTRMNDKMQRLLTLADDDKRYHESLEDTLMDLADYAVIALLVRREKWPALEAPQRHPAQQSLWDENKELKRRLKNLEEEVEQKVADWNVDKIRLFVRGAYR